MAEKCSFCGKPLGLSYKFSYGFPGVVPRVYHCDRLLCNKNWSTKLKAIKVSVINYLILKLKSMI